MHSRESKRTCPLRDGDRLSAPQVTRPDWKNALLSLTLNEAAFDGAVEEVFQVVRRLVDSLVTTTPARDRMVEAAKAKARVAQRFGGRNPGAGG